MKKNYSFIIFLFLTLASLQAQPVLNSNEMLPFGSVMVEKSINDFSIIDTSIMGSGVTWDFSALTNDTSIPDMNIHIVDPTTTPYAADFPDSNYAYKEMNGITTNYRYFNLTDTEMERVGSYVTHLKEYSDPQVEYVFPLELGTTNLDDWDNSDSSTGGTYELTCIGDGTLILPSGTYNALMVEVHVTESFLDYFAYFWYSSDNGAILIQYIEGDGLFVPESGTYLSSLTLNTPETNFNNNITYNNPVTDELRLNFQSVNTNNYNYSVANTNGQNVLQGSIKTKEGNLESLNIDFSSLQSGIYYLSIGSDETGKNKKTIKIIKK